MKRMRTLLMLMLTLTVLALPLTAAASIAESWMPSYTVEPTCTEQGYTVYENFLMPGTTENRDFVPALGHDWGEWETADEPGCEWEGTKVRYCNRCKQGEESPIPATGHTWGEWSVYMEADCESEGLKHRFCEACGQPQEEMIEALGHDWGGGEVTAQPTCTQEGVRTFTCSRCGETKTEPIEKSDHQPEKVTEVFPTCTEPGSSVIKCSVCGEKLTNPDVIPPLEHTPQVIPGTPATCDEDGLTEGVQCAVCGQVLTEQEIIFATGHVYETIPGMEATCTEAGVTPGVKCSVCGKLIDIPQEIPALDHAPVTVPGSAATCTESGLTDGSKCSRCGEILTAQQTIPALGHDYQMTFMDVTCEAGSITYSCSRCGDTYTEAGPGTGHFPTPIPAVAATCTEEGKAEGSKCSVCGKVLEAPQAVPALGHDYQQTFMDVTCEAGSITYSCTRCGDTYTETGPGTGHFPTPIPAVAATCTEEGKAGGSKCSVCGKVLEAPQAVPALGHDYQQTFMDVTCEAGSITYSCSRCGDTYTEAGPGTGHFPTPIPAVAATCTEEGKAGGSKCSVCGKVLEAPQAVPALGHDYQQTFMDVTCEAGSITYSCSRCGDTYTEAGPGTGHFPTPIPAVAATCTEGGKTEGSKCSVCGTVLTAQQATPALGHDWDEGTVTKEPGYLNPGEITYTCTRCGETKTEEIPVKNGGRSLFSGLSGWNPDSIPVEELMLSVDPGLLEPNGTPLRIVKQPAGGTFDHGGAFSISVEAAGGDPYYSYQWYRASSEEEQLAAAGLLNLLLALLGSDASVTPEQMTAIPVTDGVMSTLTVTVSGVYYCVVTDEAGDSVTSEKATVVENLHITEEPQNCKLGGGMSVTVCGGMPPYAYAWYMDGGDSVYSSDRSLKQLELTGSHEFFCVVTDRLGNAVTTQKANYYEKNVFGKTFLEIRGPKEVEYLGDYTSIDVNYYSNIGLLHFQWIKDGAVVEEIQTKSSDYWDYSDEDRWYRKYLLVEEEGTYWCVVSDAAETVTSDKITVKKKDLNVRPRYGSVYHCLPGETVTMEIKWDHNAPYGRYDVLWQYCPLNEYEYQDISDAAKETLTVDKPGFYRATVSDNYGQQGSTDLTVWGEELNFLDQPEGGHMRYGEKTFPITAIVNNGTAPFGFVLYRLNYDGVWEMYDFIEESDTRRCYFKTKLPGEYYIEVTDAQDGLGESKHFEITAADPLVVADYTQGATVQSKDGTAYLDLRVSGGTPPYDFKWERLSGLYPPNDPRFSYDKEYVTLENGKIMEIRGVDFMVINAGIGLYRCIVTDAEGQKTGISNVKVTYDGSKPVIVKQSVSETFNPTNQFLKKTLICEAYAAPGHELYYTWYKKGESESRAVEGGKTKSTIYLDEDHSSTYEDQVCGIYFCLVQDLTTGEYVKSKEITIRCWMEVTAAYQVGHTGSMNIEIKGGCGPFQVKKVERHRKHWIATTGGGVLDDIWETMDMAWCAAHVKLSGDIHGCDVSVTGVQTRVKERDYWEEYYAAFYHKCYTYQHWTYYITIVDGMGREVEVKIGPLDS